MKKNIMRGISAPLLTPYRPDGHADCAAFAKLTAYITGNGAHGVFVGGTTGEFVNSTLEERMDLLQAAREGAADGTHILFNVTAMNLRDLERLINCAREYGADAVSVTPPYYHKYDACALTEYFCRISRMTEDLPLYLYNMPGMTGNPITPAMLGQLVRHCPNLMGIKDSSMDFMTLLEYQCQVDKPEFEMITGNDAQVLPALQAGCAGAVIAMASVVPQLCRTIWDSFQEGDLESARAAQKKVLHLRGMARSIMPVMTHKAMLEEFGFRMGPARFPMRELTAEERRRIHEGLASLELLPAGAVSI